MVKHYEHLWEEAEIEASKAFADNINAIEDIKDYLLYFTAPDYYEVNTPEKLEEIMGDIIFALCYLSKIYNVNAYTALRNAIDASKVDRLESTSE